MGVFDNIRAVSKKLIDKYGQTVQYSVVSNPTPLDSNKPWVETRSSSKQPKEIKMVFLPDDRDKREYRNYKDKSEIPKGNVIGFTYYTDFEPKLYDIILRGSVTYTIEAIDKIQPNSSDSLLYKIRLS